MRIALAVCCLLPLAASPAAAHAILVDSQPASGATLAAGPAPITLRFNSRIDHERSRIELRGAGVAPVVLPLLPSGADTLATRAELAPGAWVLRWQVLAVDGHITRGDLPITVQPRGR